jgi:hypothetical protein
MTSILFSRSRRTASIRSGRAGGLAGNRDRGESRDSSPPTPPYVRVRIRRFGELGRSPGRDGSQTE